MNIRILSALLILLSLISCGKEEEAAVLKAPINFLQPSTDPANIVRGAPIKYDIRFVNDEYIDSVMLFYQIDFTGEGYASGSGPDPNVNPKDSLIRKVVYKANDQKNEKSIDGSFMPDTFPAIGKKIHLIVKMRSKSRNPDKRLVLNVN